MFEFPKHNRLLTRSDFDQTIEAGSKAISSRLVIVARQTGSPARLGLVVSKKVGKSVERNRVKRLVRESFRHKAGTLTGWDLVVIARTQANGATSCEIDRDLSYCLRQVLKKRPAVKETKTEATCYATPC
jgi:ribonuclease P protein component